jgi:hypothetical protein
MPENLTESENTTLPDDAAEEIDQEESDQLVEGMEGGATVVGFFPRLSSKLPFCLRSQYLWWILAWLCGFSLAVRFGWGAVFFCLSVLLLIWKSLADSRRKKQGAPSAYSVFNPNCEAIEGTLDAEQLQRQMFFRF